MLSDLRLRLRSLFRHAAVENDLSEELRFHFDQQVEKLIQLGLPLSEARRRARLEFGGADQIKEEYRDSSGVRFLEILVQDLRFALRIMRKSPGFVSVAILTLALGIGANTAIFSLMDAVLLRMLPVKNPQQLVLFTSDDNKWPNQFSQTGYDARFSFSYPQYDAFRNQNKTLSSVFAFAPLDSIAENTAVTINGETTLANGMMVTGDYFNGLGVMPLLGRGIADQDEDKGAPRVAVISYAYWTQRFARNPEVIGEGIELNSIPCTIVGVAPQAFNGVEPGRKPDIYMAFDDLPNLRPWSEAPTDGDSAFTDRNWMELNIMGRLKPGVTQEKAEAELNVLYRNFITSDWKPAKASDIPAFTLTPASQGIPYLQENYTQPLQILMAMVGLGLLIACANVATLLLARASARQKEISVRLAIGASRWRLVRQLITESVLLAIAGGALGLLFAGWGTNMLLAMYAGGPTQIALDVKPSATVLLFTFAVAVLTGVLFGLAPALRASRMDLASVMKDAATSTTAGHERHHLGNSLVVAQVAASLVLLVGAGLFVRTLVNYEVKNYGFSQEHLLMFGVNGTRQGYQSDRLVNLYSQIQERLEALPGVTSATQMSNAPFSGWSSNTVVSFEGRPTKKDNPLRWMRVSPDFFRTMQIPVILGRAIQASDTLASPRVAVVDENFVKKYLPNENPIGQRFWFGRDPNPERTFEIVGVSKPAELINVHAAPRPKAYMAYAQIPGDVGARYFELRTSGDPDTVVSEVRDAVRGIDPGLPLMGLKTQTEQRDEALVQERLFARLSGFFGLLALALAIIGLYGTMSYAVSRKTHEIGIRMALGAEPGHMMRMVVGRGLRLAGIGAAIGIAAALGAARLTESMIFGVTPDDPWTFAGAAIALLLVALVACYIPARRAMRVDPMIALRYE